MGLFDFLKSKPKAEPQPQVAQQSSTTLTVKVVGTEYRDVNAIMALGKPNPDFNLDKRGLIKKFPDGATVYEYVFPEYTGSFEFEPTNEHDPKAIKVLVQGLHVGYVKKGSCSRIRNLINQNEIISISAKIYGGNNKDLICMAGIDEKPTSTDYELEKNKDNFGVTLTLTIVE